MIADGPDRENNNACPDGPPLYNPSMRLAPALLLSLAGCAAVSWEDRLGQDVTLEGVAVDDKAGARLELPGDSIWLDRNAWPRGFYGKRVRVTGVVIRRDDLPVFIPEPGEQEEARAGIPVPPGTDPRQARVRYLLANPAWTKLEE